MGDINFRDKYEAHSGKTVLIQANEQVEFLLKMKRIYDLTKDKVNIIVSVWGETSTII